MLDLTVDPLITGAQIALAGVSIVFIALALVAVALGLLGRVNLPGKASPAAPAPAPVKTAPLPAPAAALSNGHVSPELIAVISAAAADMFGQPVRVTRIRYERQPGAGAWSSSGRISIMNSRRRQK
jgi:glutaconyl-CoA/methylmalonyl-CoA decarboxylase subunit delta